MSTADRETVSRSISNLWTFNALFIGHLLHSLQKGGIPVENIEEALQNLDRDCEILEGHDDQIHATNLLASVRMLLRGP